ncbi:MAG TPA: anti-sigma factor antagonist [Vicinamibacterales bacterium]|nr:anti-sigma factor antagonist [Vicinamibacterales bacterium]
MQLSLEHRRVGDATIVTCKGRLVAGAEAKALEDLIEELLPKTKYLVLHLGEVDSLDSGGLGLLVRYLMRAQRSKVSLSVCALSPKIDEVLRITKLRPVFTPYECEADAIADVYKRDTLGASQTTVLCVDSSTDLTAYLREMLRAAGYRAISAQNLPDAMILLIATKPKVVLVSSEIAAYHGTRTAEEFHKMTAGRLVTLPEGFSGRDAADAAGEVLRAVGAAC